jgi:hypothetical protein
MMPKRVRDESGGELQIRGIACIVLSEHWERPLRGNERDVDGEMKVSKKDKI